MRVPRQILKLDTLRKACDFLSSSRRKPVMILPRYPARPSILASRIRPRISVVKLTRRWVAWNQVRCRPEIICPAWNASKVKTIDVSEINWGLQNEHCGPTYVWQG
jgi:hypothetical protein